MVEQERKIVQETTRIERRRRRIHRLLCRLHLLFTWRPFQVESCHHETNQRVRRNRRSSKIRNHGRGTECCFPNAFRSRIFWPQKRRSKKRFKRKKRRFWTCFEKRSSWKFLYWRKTLCTRVSKRTRKKMHRSIDCHWRTYRKRWMQMQMIKTRRRRRKRRVRIKMSNFCWKRNGCFSNRSFFNRNSTFWCKN